MLTVKLLALAGGLMTLGAAGDVASDNNPDAPAILGYGIGRFKVAETLRSGDLDHPDRWGVQMERKSFMQEGGVTFNDGKLRVTAPGRGCTIWLKEKLPGRIAILYDVVAFGKTGAIGVTPRDINCFWMASDPESAGGIFDEKRYAGRFSDYDKLHCYYASTGGAGNRTTRFRRYPREVNGAHAPHIALQDKDGKKDYLIEPDKAHRMQLVCFDDVVQYIVDGKVVYQIKDGDKVTVETENAGRASLVEDTCAVKTFPPYGEGCFGFRLTTSCHEYSNFRVCRLEPETR